MSLFPVSAPPPQVDVKPYFELRQRFERRTNRDFDSRIDDDRGDLLSRWRVGAKLDFRNGWRGEIQYQYAHDLAWTRARNFSDESSDVSLAYAESALPGWTATLGRQKIAVGQQRLIGPSEWANVPRSMDGVRFRNPEWDLFAFKIGVGAPRSGDARVAGLVHQNKMYGDTMLVFKHDQMAAGSQDIWTLSHLFVKSFGKVTVDAEAALQTGRNTGRRHEAWAVHLRAMWPERSKLKPFLEFNAASGGTDVNRSRAFDNLYPTNHGKYGLADTTGWSNMNHVAVGVEHAARRDVTARAIVHSMWLQNARDAWYSAGGSPNRRAGAPLQDATGGSGTHLGTELDLEVVYTPTKLTSISGGFAVFSPGSFVRNVTGRRDAQFWMYLQVGTRF